MRKALSSAIVLAVVGGAVAVSAIATAGRSPFIDLDTVQTTVGDQAATGDQSEEAAADVVDLSDALVRPASLMAVADLPPNEWPWFADGVQTPPDAVAEGADLVAAFSRTPGLADFKVLSAERKVYPGAADLQWRRAWLKVTNTELLRVGTQLVTDDIIIPQDYPNIVAYAGGSAQYRTEERRINLILVVGDRMVLIDVVLTNGSDGPLTLTADDLLRMASGVIDNM